MTFLSARAFGVVRHVIHAGILSAFCFCAHAAVTVSVFATSGTGIASDPWLGWDIATPWAAETEFYFPGGTYSYSVSPNFLKAGLVLRGEAGTVLKFTGTGNAVVFDGPVSWTKGARMENFTIDGNVNAVHGLFLRGIWSGAFKNITVQNVTGAGIWAEALVANVMENIVVWRPPESTINPAYGIVLAGRGGDWTTTTVVTNPNIGMTTIAGIWIKAASYANTFIGGTSETNLGKGMVIDGPLNVVINTDFEQNGGGVAPYQNVDVEINNSSNELIGVFSSHLIDVKAGQLNKLRGRFHDVRISYTCDFTDVSGAYMSGTLIDEGQTTTKFAYQTGQGLIYRSCIGKVCFEP